MSVVPQPTEKPKPRFRIGVVLAVVLAVVVFVLFLGNRELQNARQKANDARQRALDTFSASITPTTTASSVDQTTADADKKTMEALAQVQLVNPTIQMDSIGQPELHVTVKNNATKAIDGIVIFGHFKDNFGDPVTSYSSTDGFHANDQTTIQPGATTNDVWSLFGYTNATKVSDIKVVRVHFTDGTDFQDPSYTPN